MNIDDRAKKSFLDVSCLNGPGFTVITAYARKRYRPVQDKRFDQKGVANLEKTIYEDKPDIVLCNTKFTKGRFLNFFSDFEKNKL